MHLAARFAENALPHHLLHLPDVRDLGLFTARDALLHFGDDLRRRIRLFNGGGEQIEGREIEIAFCQIGKITPVWGVVIDRLEAGRIKDTRILMDALGLMMQLGALPPSAT
jgi:hypothetical protein